MKSNFSLAILLILCVAFPGSLSAEAPYGTPLTLAASEVSEQHKLLMLTCAASGKVIWERGFRSDFWNNAEGMTNQVFGPSQWEPSERIPFPGTKEFVNKFKHFSNKIPSYHAGSAYAACQLYEDAIRQTQSLDNEKIRYYISSLDTVTIIGRFKVNQSGTQIGHNPIVIQWQSGKKEIVWRINIQTASPLL